MVKRLQLFEFCDMPWLKGIIREGFLDCLNNIHRYMEPYRNIAPIVDAWAKRLHAHELFDIGSGGGEQVGTILKYIQERHEDAPRFILSDLYPDPIAYRDLERRFGPERISYLSHSVGVANLPSDKKVLTIFSAFHHLPPEVASALLAEVVANRDGICIIEFTRRTALDLLSMFPAFFINILAPFTARTFHVGKLLWGTIIPVIPAMVSFDGFVSALRSYTVEEILAMLPPETEKTFLVEYGEVPWGTIPLSKSSYFLLTRRET